MNNSEYNELVGSIAQLTKDVALIKQNTENIYTHVKKINGRVDKLEDELEELVIEVKVKHAERGENCPYKDIINGLNKYQFKEVAVKQYSKEQLALLIGISGLLIAIATYLFIIAG